MLIEQLIIVCNNCGTVINNDEIEYTNKCNEEGEDYAEVYAECNVCKKEYEASQWGHFDNKEESVELLKDKFKLWVVSQFEIMENKTKYKVIDLPNDGKAIEVDGKLIQGIPIREDNFHLLINELCKMSGTKNYEYQLGDIKYCGNPSSNINSTSL